MGEILTQLVTWILPPIALPRALPIIIEGGVLEAAVIRSGASKSVASVVGLVETPATICGQNSQKSGAAQQEQKMECWVWAAEEHVWQQKICEEIHV